MTDRLSALHSSVTHLRNVVNDTAAFSVTASAFPTEWSVADTMSHVGSGAVILKQRLLDTLAQRETPEGFNQTVWDAWNAKSPADQVTDALIADEELLLALETTTPEQRRAFHFTMGPFDLDFDGFVGLRLNEQALHTWDVEYAFNPSVTLSPDVADAIIDGLHLIIRFAGKANGENKKVTVRTVAPSRDFTLVYAGDSISVENTAVPGDADLELTGEAFVRLVYGRLSPVASLPASQQSRLEHLRSSFPGF